MPIQVEIGMARQIADSFRVCRCSASDIQRVVRLPKSEIHNAGHIARESLLTILRCALERQSNDFGILVAQCRQTPQLFVEALETAVEGGLNPLSSFICRSFELFAIDDDSTGSNSIVEQQSWIPRLGLFLPIGISADDTTKVWIDG